MKARRCPATIKPNLTIKEYFGLKFLFFHAQKLRVHIINTSATREIPVQKFDVLGFKKQLRTPVNSKVPVFKFPLPRMYVVRVLSSDIV